MKTIVFILPNLDQGGAERVITILLNELDRSKYIPKLILFKKEGYYLNLLKKDVEIFELNTSRIRYSIFKILPLLWKLKPSIVLTGWGEISAFISPLIPLFGKTKFITRETNVVSKHVTRPEILFFYRFYNNFDCIIAQSRDMKEDLIENFKINSKRINTINNPVDFDLINRKKEEQIDFTFTKEGKHVVAIGNLAKRKGFDLLLNVFIHLKDEPIHLYILGDGIEKEALWEQKLKGELVNVHFLGKVDNPYAYMKLADLFILSSRYEGFPNVLLEAGACGVYALANDCPGGVNEIIEHQINGEISSIIEEDTFANKVKEVLSVNVEKAKVIHSIESRFSKEKIVQEYELIFNEL